MKPNFIVIVADDLGFTDLSAFGGEIDTPNLKRLADNGLRFTDFHTASACSPTRSMLLSGTDNHIAGLGQMAEHARNHPEVFEGKPGYEGYLNFRVGALSEILQDAGYYNFISGKWHLGLLPDYWPSKRGFEKAFTLLPGAGNHYKYFPQAGDSPNFMSPLYAEGDKSFDPDNLPEDFYSTDYYTDKFIEYLNHESRQDRPFLGLLTYTAPHWPYQAPKEVVDKYKGFYKAGPEVLRLKRLESAAKLGLIPEGVTAHPLVTARKKRWDELSQHEQDTEARIMETYAAMIDVLDQNIGKVIKALEDKNELDNTFIVFMSDNGAEGMLLESLPLFNAKVDSLIDEFFDNSLDNIGRGNSFVWYSDQWAQAATAPSNMYKMWTTEGGIRCPLIIHHPNIIKEESRGSVKHEFATVMDVLPTILDLAGVEHPGETFRGKKIAPVRGKSWKSYITGESEKVHSDDTVTGWELFGQQAIRKGHFKAVYIPQPLGTGEWQLFDLKKDPGEINDLASTNNDKLQELLEHWSTYVAETGLVDATGTRGAEDDFELKIVSL
ncbi:hypothetical protein CLIB1444_14S02740 [[Candida] jaroonii]|uniref:Uncharacterized protein n=1 Tax=[Candida] jaroonii TaxID=467808 RepID=A0ACA9YE66_9ASCO|nr:hypothetical protein CLIB1444_14S02740 [[Candida] jaroonii]